MDEIKNNELQEKLYDVQSKLNKNIVNIQENINEFLNAHTNKLKNEDVSDLNIITENCQRLDRMLKETISENKIMSLNSNKDFEEYLIKTRHDMHNLLNIILGYTELVVTNFQQQNETEYLNEISKVIPSINQIMILTQEIRTFDTPAPDLNSFIIADMEDNVEIDKIEYKEFKKRISILIVDNLPENCYFLERFLNQLGYENITIANDGLQALGLLTKNKYDLVLLDNEMPNITGKQVLEHIKEDLRKQKYMVIIISGYDTAAETVECIRLGAEDLILKPFDPDLLRVRIQNCVIRKWYTYHEKLIKTKYEVINKNLFRAYYALNVFYLLWKLY